MGRPSIGRKIELRLDDETLQAVDKRAEREGVRRPEMIRRLIAAGLR